MKHNISQAELKALMGQKASLCLSLYLNLHKGEDFKQAKLQLKNYIKECEELLAPELDRASLEASFLNPLRELASSEKFWRSLKNSSLVIFLAPGFQVIYNLYDTVADQLYWGDRFHTLPLVKLANSSAGFLLLSLSQHSVKLLKCSRFDCEELALKDTPSSLDEFLQFDESARGQAHSSEVVGPFGRGTSVFYGNGDWKDGHKAKIKEFFKQINKAVVKECHAIGSTDIPLILAGVDYIQGLYREENTYVHLLEHGISGNPELKQSQILKAACDLVEQQLMLKQEAENLKYQNRLGAERSVCGVEEIIKQAHLGKVDVLFLPQKNGAAQKTEDLFDLAANQTILHGGKVLLVDENKISGVSDGIALLRYAS